LRQFKRGIVVNIDDKLELAVVVAIAYWGSLWMLGVVWWKAPIVGFFAALIFLTGWAGRWISRGAVALLVVATLVWIEALPPPSQWRPAAGAVLAFL
jgi:hypothetical protein